MNCLHSRARLFITVCLATLAALSLSACGHTESWKEQVLLHNGQMIVVTRTMDLARPDGAGNREPLRETLTFTPPGASNSITWKTSFNDSSRKQNSLNPMLVDIVQGAPYIVAEPAGCISYNKWHRPNPPYIALKYRRGHWTHISLKELPAELVHANLIDPPDPGEVKALYTLKDVHDQFQDAVPESMTVFRKPIQTNWVMCPVLVPITSGPFKGGWGAPGADQWGKYFHYRHH